jgi:hypothetical protein
MAAAQIQVGPVGWDLAAAAYLGQHHRSEVPGADDDVDGIAAQPRQASLCEELKDRWHHRIHRRGSVVVDYPPVAVHGEAQYVFAA